MKPDWFAKGKFIKKFKDGEDFYYQWNVKGLQNNFYESLVDSEKAHRIYSEPISDINFGSDYTQNFPEKVFDLPNKQELNGGSCETKCPALSFCTFVV